MKRIVGLLTLLGLVIGLSLSTTVDASNPRHGFVAAYGSGGTNNANIVPDLTKTSGNTWGSFDVDPLTVFGTGVNEVRILRYHNNCSSYVNSSCNETETDLANVASAHHGLIFELGNEPGVATQDDGGSGFVTWENATYHAIKNADATAKVYGPGVLNWDGGGWGGIPNGRDIYNGTLWGALSFDAVALHIYPADVCMGSTWRSTALAQIDAATSAGYAGVLVTETGDQSAECAYYGYATPAPTVITGNVAALVAEDRTDGAFGELFFLNRPGNNPGCPASCTNALLSQDGTTLSADGLGW